MENRPDLEVEEESIYTETLEEPNSFEEDAFSEKEMSLWQRVRNFFFPSHEEQAKTLRQRLQELNASIERYPQAAVNYLLRGELHLEQKQVDLAQEDFEKALSLAEEAFSQETWGISSQMIADRARTGLEDVLRYS